MTTDETVGKFCIYVQNKDMKIECLCSVTCHLNVLHSMHPCNHSVGMSFFFAQNIVHIRIKYPSSACM